MLALLTLLVTTLLASCQRDTRPTQLQGAVIDVKVASFSQISSFQMRTDTGEVVELIVEGDVGITPGHLREHMVLGQGVVVTIKRDGDLLIATLIEDAPEP